MIVDRRWAFVLSRLTRDSNNPGKAVIIFLHKIMVLKTYLLQIQLSILQFLFLHSKVGINRALRRWNYFEGINKINLNFNLRKLFSIYLGVST